MRVFEVPYATLFAEYLELLRQSELADIAALLEDRYHAKWMLQCRQPITELIERYGLHGRRLLSVGCGEAFEEFWFWRHGGCALTLLDSNPEFAERLERPHEAFEGPMLQFVSAAIEDYIPTAADGAFDACYVSSLPPDEERRYQIRRQHETLVAQDPGAMRIGWPEDARPVWPGILDCTRLMTDGGLLFLQSYRGAPDMGRNPHVFWQMAAQFRAAGLELLELHWFRRLPTRFLAVAVKGDAAAARAWHGRLAGRAPLTCFHGRHDGAERFDIVSVSALPLPGAAPSPMGAALRMLAGTAAMQAGAALHLADLADSPMGRGAAMALQPLRGELAALLEATASQAGSRPARRILLRLLRDLEGTLLPPAKRGPLQRLLDGLRRRAAPEPATETGAEEELVANAYWDRYTDVAQHGTYGRNGELGLAGARRHWIEHGRNEGRVWGA